MGFTVEAARVIPLIILTTLYHLCNSCKHPETCSCVRGKGVVNISTTAWGVYEDWGPLFHSPLTTCRKKLQVKKAVKIEQKKEAARKETETGSFLGPVVSPDPKPCFAPLL